MNYAVQQGDSPSSIAQKFGMTLGDLLAANPQKPTTVVSGVTTWQSLAINEKLTVPSGVGAAAAVAVNALSTDSNYCKSVAHPGSPVNRAVHNFKKEWNKANPGAPLPVGTGKYEVTVAAALSSVVGRVDAGATVPAGCNAGKPVGTFAPITGVSDSATDTGWKGLPSDTTIATDGWKGLPQNTTITPPASPPPEPPALPAPSTSTGQTLTAAQALAAVNPCDQTNAGLVQAFQKSASVTPDGKYGHATAKALAKQIPGAPAACSPRPAWWGSASHGKAHPPPPTPAFVPSPPSPGFVPPPMPVASTATPAAQFLAALDPCDQANAGAVRAFQQSAGVTPDGKYGHITARMLAQQVPGAPAACSPRPGWWTSRRHVPPPPVVTAPAPLDTPPVAVQDPAPPAPAPAVVPPTPPVASDGTVQPKKHEKPEEEGVSKAMIAGGVGVVALLAVVVVASVGKKSSTSDREAVTTRTRRSES
jgi:hypothetical protein